VVSNFKKAKDKDLVKDILSLTSIEKNKIRNTEKMLKIGANDFDFRKHKEN
jgi:hypothetical protein